MLKSNIVQQSNNTTPNMNCSVNSNALQNSNDAVSDISRLSDLHSKFCINNKFNQNEISSNSTEITFDDMIGSDSDRCDLQKLACSPKKLNFKNNSSFSNFQMSVGSLKKTNSVPFLNLDSIKQNSDENEGELNLRAANNQEIET